MQLTPHGSRWRRRNINTTDKLPNVSEIPTRIPVAAHDLSGGEERNVLEAMASGCACAASDIPSSRYILDEERADLLCPDGNPEALANAIERLLSDQALADRLRAHALERVKCFNSKRMAEDYIKLYMTLIKEYALP